MQVFACLCYFPYRHDFSLRSATKFCFKANCKANWENHPQAKHLKNSEASRHFLQPYSVQGGRLLQHNSQHKPSTAFGRMCRRHRCGADTGNAVSSAPLAGWLRKSRQLSSASAGRREGGMGQREGSHIDRVAWGRERNWDPEAIPGPLTAYCAC